MHGLLISFGSLNNLGNFIDIISYLKSQNIDSRPFFYPIHTMPPYQASISLPIAENLSRQGINLPSAVTMNEEKIDRVVTALKHELRT